MIRANKKIAENFGYFFCRIKSRNVAWFNILVVIVYGKPHVSSFSAAYILKILIIAVIDDKI